MVHKRKKMRDFVDMSKPLTTAQLLKEYRGRKKAGFYDSFGVTRNVKNPINPHPHTKIQLKKMTKAGLIRLVIKLEKFIVNHAYEMYKAKLPRLRTTRQKGITHKKIPIKLMDYSVASEFPKRKTKRKKLTGAAKAKFLARMNKGRRKKGLKPIRSR